MRQGEEARQVRVERDGEGWRVSVDGHDYRIDSSPLAAGSRSLLIDGAQHAVGVRRLAENRYAVATVNHSEEVAVVDPLTHLAEESRGGSGGGGRDQVTAYMPGRVVTLLVQEGATVEDGQGVLVLEAMKMENEIAAERSGTLKKLFVEVGQAVEGGDPLFEIE